MANVQYRYKGRFVSQATAARLGNLKHTSQYLQTSYRDKYRGPALYSTTGYKHGTALATAVAMTRDRLEREERIQRRAEIEQRARDREIERRLDYERRRIEDHIEGGPEAPERPYFPAEYYEEEEVEMGIGGPIEDWELDELDDFDIDMQWEVADIDDEEYEER